MCSQTKKLFIKVWKKTYEYYRVLMFKYETIFCLCKYFVFYGCRDFTITTITGVNTQKCVRRKIQHFTPSSLVEHWWIHYNYITIIPKVGNTIYYVYSKQYTGNLEQVPVRQNQLIVSFYEKNGSCILMGKIPKKPLSSASNVKKRQTI
jgi:hypothetical protein